MGRVAAHRGTRRILTRAVSQACVIALGILSASSLSSAQTAQRRLATLDALRQFPGYYHLENVLLRGEFAEDGPRILFRAADQEIRVVLGDDVRTETGPVEIRAQLIDIGRLEPGDPRVPGEVDPGDAERWPRPGEVLVLRVTAVVAAQPTAPSVRALALEPWRFVGQSLTLVGQFRGRNLLGDLPASPARGRYDFVLRSADGAIWVTGLRPRGRDLDLSVDVRADTGRWVQVTGTVVHERGLVMLEGSAIATASEPATERPSGEAEAPPPPLQPVEVVFSSPTPDETEVPRTTSVRVQFSRGLRPASLDAQIRVSYLGAEPDAVAPEFKHSYDAANRAVEIKFSKPLDPLRTLRVEFLDGVRGFDGSPFQAWSLTFSVGS